MTGLISYAAFFGLSIGLFLLALSASLSKVTIVQKPRIPNVAIAIAAFVVSVSILRFVPPVEGAVSRAFTFASLCKTAGIQVVEQAINAKGVAVIPDEIFLVDHQGGLSKRGVALWVLNSSSLEFVERPSPSGSSPDSTKKFERIATVGERVLSGDATRSTLYAYTQVASSEAEYELISHEIGVARGHELRMGGVRAEIIRRSDRRVIGYAQYFWNATAFQVCPKQNLGSDHIVDLVKGTFHFTEEVRRK